MCRLRYHIYFALLPSWAIRPRGRLAPPSALLTNQTCLARNAIADLKTSSRHCVRPQLFRERYYLFFHRIEMKPQSLNFQSSITKLGKTSL